MSRLLLDTSFKLSLTKPWDKKIANIRSYLSGSCDYSHTTWSPREIEIVKRQMPEERRFADEAIMIRRPILFIGDNLPGGAAKQGIGTVERATSLATCLPLGFPQDRTVANKNHDIFVGSKYTQRLQCSSFVGSIL